MKFLHIIASPRGEKSRTLEVSNEFLTTLKSKYPTLSIDELDLSTVTLPEVQADMVESKYAMMFGQKLADEAQTNWAKIMELSKQFASYDAYLISSPMWNFNIPYKLKQYIDVIVQAGVLFNYTENGVEGMLKNKKMVCVTSRGSDYSEGSEFKSFDFQEPYLRTVFGFTGIYDMSFVHAQPLDFTPEITKGAIEKAKNEVRKLAEEFAGKQ